MDESSQQRLAARFEELAGFMVASARGLLSEPQGYGPMRLVDATSRLILVLEREGLSTAVLARVREQIEEGQDEGRMDEGPDEAMGFLDELVIAFLNEPPEPEATSAGPGASTRGAAGQ